MATNNNLVLAKIPKHFTPRMHHIASLLGKPPLPLQKTLISHQSKATPLARLMAHSFNLDLLAIRGTGIKSKITSADVLAARKQVSANQQKPEVLDTQERREDIRKKVTPIRRAIAKAMRNSWDSVAYTNLVVEINVTKLWDLRAVVKEDILKTRNVKITFLSFIIKAICIALKDFPQLNAFYDEKTQELVYRGPVNMGVAVDTPKGLVVPVIKNTDLLDVVSIGEQIINFAKLARASKLKMQDMQGGTFTVTNYGSVGALFGVPVINHPEVAIAGLGTITDKPVVTNGKVTVAKTMYLTVAADHRWVDGADIARFATRVKTLLSEPALIWFNYRKHTEKGA